MTKLKRILRLFSTLAILAGVMVFGQNCSISGFETINSDELSLSSSESTFAEFRAAKSVLTQNCTSCHFQGGTSPRLDYGSEQEFLLSGLIVAGSPDQSKLIQRLKNFTGTSAQPKNMPPSTKLSDGDYATLRRWTLLAGGATFADPFQCDKNQTIEASVPKTNIRTLSVTQYRNTVADFIKLALPTSHQSIYDSQVKTISFPAESDARYSRSVSEFDPQKLDSIFKVTDGVVNKLVEPANFNSLVTNLINLNAGSCTAPQPASLSEECKKQFIRNVGQILYRRPLIENTELNEVEEFKSEFQINADSTIAVANLIFRLMMSQNFLFQMENQGEKANAANSVVALTSHEIASRLSYSLWNSMPDQTLFNMARNNDLRQDSHFNEALNYALTSPRFEGSLKEFAYGWLLLKKTPQFDPNDAGIKTFNEGIVFDATMKNEMISEAETLFAYTTRKGAPFSELFNTDVSVTRYAPLMQVYGVSTAAANPLNDSVRMPAGTRAGLLTRAALLAEGNGRQHLIHRAIRIKRDILCLSTPPPPADTSPPIPLTEEQISSFTTRQKFVHNTSPNVCYSCHQSINPFGFALSKYNGLGFFKITEPAFTSAGVATGVQLPLDSTSNLADSLSQGPTVQDGIEYSNVVSKRVEAQACFTKNFATYLDQRETNTDKEGCRLNKMARIINRSGSITDSMSAIITDPAFRLRRLEN